MSIKTELDSALREPWNTNRGSRLVTLGLLLAIVGVCPERCPGEGVATPIVLTQVPLPRKPSSPASCSSALFQVEGFDGARVVVVSPKGEVRVLSHGFRAACDPDVSFDGRRVVFAGKKYLHSPWAIWETGVEGGQCRLVSQQARDCRSPVYLSSLFTLDSPGPWFTVLYVGREDVLNEQGTGYATSLYSVKLDGTEPRRISFNPKGDLDPVQVLDGRVIYAGWRNGAQVAGTGGGLPLQAEGCRCSLFGISIDGTDQELYGGEQGKSFQRMPCATERGLIVFVEADAPSGEGGGQLGAVEERRPHHSYRRVPADERYAYLYPSPLRGNTILVSRRAREGKGNWCVVTLNVENGQAEPVFEGRGFDAMQARAARARPVPDGRSTVVNLEYDTGILYALNLYEADERLKPHLAPGSIQRVRVIEGVPAQMPRGGLSSSCPPSFGRRLLGEAPVEKDGSLHLLVPADTALELQALDADGSALATCRWIWVKQKENRGCIGCHEEPELVPENIYAQALQRPANKLTLAAERRRGVAFREQILPLLQAKCAGTDCHGGGQARLPLDLRQKAAAPQAVRKVYETLLAPGSPQPQVHQQGVPQSRQSTSGAEPNGFAHGKYVDPGCARTSFLIWELSGRDKSQPWDRSCGPVHANREIKQMPPPGRAPPLTEEEFRLFVEWIDLGAAWEAPSQPTGAVATMPAKAKRAAPAQKGGM
jgi:hypothetical protein